MVKKDLIKKVYNEFQKLFRKKTLPQGVVFIEKPSFIPLLGVYIVGMVFLILVWKLNKDTIPFLVSWFVNFFKGVKYEWVEGIFIKIVSLIYILILVFIFYYQIKREITTYILSEKEIIIKKGLFVRKEVYLPLEKVRNLSLNVSLIGLIFKYGTILVDTGGFIGMIAMPNIPNPKDKVRQILNLIDKKTDKF